MAARYEREIPEGYEARIEGNKVIIELKESADERIRKFLIQHISEWIGCIEHDLKISPEDIESEKELAMFKAGLAYLEKQKDNKFAPRVLPCSAAWFEDGEEKQKEQKPLPGFDELTPNEKMNHPLYREGFVAGQKEAEQKPAEWSEDDKNLLDSLILLYSKEYSADPWPWANGVFTYGDVVNFLKSLRPDSYKNCNSRWKPSEEQMAALNRCILIGNEDMIYALNSLCDDLKKLI